MVGWNEGGEVFACLLDRSHWKDLAEMRRYLWLEEGRKGLDAF